jgi:hypothetical protein
VGECFAHKKRSPPSPAPGLTRQQLAKTAIF